jgi:Ca2+-binding RTX toxin-like protein
MNDTVTGGVLVDLISYENVYVKQGVSAGSIGASAIEGTGDYHYVQVMGDLFGTVNAITFGDSSNSIGNEIIIGATGSISGMPGGGVDTGRFSGDAILIFGTDTQIINRGQVFGEGTGIELITSGGGGGLKSLASDDADSLIVNQGEIQGLDIGINHQADETLTIKNRGTIDGGHYAITGGSGVENVINRGTIVGDIDLGGGSDIYDGRKGGPIEGIVTGGAGQDMLYGGKGADWLAGGLGKDTLTGGPGSDTFLFNTSLDGAVDVIVDFEADPFNPAHDWIAWITIYSLLSVQMISTRSPPTAITCMVTSISPKTVRSAIMRVTVPR